MLLEAASGGVLLLCAWLSRRHRRRLRRLDQRVSAAWLEQHIRSRQ